MDYQKINKLLKEYDGKGYISKNIKLFLEFSILSVKMGESEKIPKIKYFRDICKISGRYFVVDWQEEQSFFYCKRICSQPLEVKPIFKESHILSVEWEEV